MTQLALRHDSLTKLSYTLLLVLWTLYGIPGAMENPHASMRLVPGMRSLLLREEVQVQEVNYCVFDHPYWKLTDIFHTLPGLALQGCTGNGRCLKWGRCLDRWGHRSQETQLWNHHFVLGRESSREYGQGLERELYKNKVPEDLLQEILDAARIFWANVGKQATQANYRVR